MGDNSGGIVDGKKPRGFAALSPEERRRVSSLGGKSGGHRWTKTEARKQGKRGGKASGKRRAE